MRRWIYKLGIGRSGRVSIVPPSESTGAKNADAGLLCDFHVDIVGLWMDTA